MALEIKQCILTKNDCYKQGKKIKPAGIVVHSTGANNPSISRYVQPDDGILGDNKYDNDWNRSGVSKCVHAMIGKDKNGVVRVYQTLPWDYRCWGCGSGSKGSYNDNFIQFEICEDSLTDSTYFNKAFELAMELCAHLAKTYNIPVKNIVSHKEAHKLGYASNHGDCDNWLAKFNKTMDWFRNGVNDILNPKVQANTASSVYYPKYTGNALAGLDSILATIGVPAQYRGSWKARKPLAEANGISNYTGSGKDNSTLKSLAKSGKLKKVGASTVQNTTQTAQTNSKPATTPTVSQPAVQYYPKYTGTSSSISDALKSLGIDGSFKNRSKIAKANNIKAYVGLSSQNTTMLRLLKEGKLIKA